MALLNKIIFYEKLSGIVGCYELYGVRKNTNGDNEIILLDSFGDNKLCAENRHILNSRRDGFILLKCNQRSCIQECFSIALHFLFNLGRNIKATALWFLLGVMLSVSFQRYVPADDFAELCGKSNKGFGVLIHLKRSRELLLLMKITIKMFLKL